MKTDILMNGSMVHKTTSHFKTIFGHSATRRTSFRWWFLACERVLLAVSPSLTSMTLSRQEIDHPTFSSSSSTSPTITVSGDSVTRRAREDLCGIDSYPVARGELLTKPTKNHKAGTGRPVLFRHTGMAARIQRKSRGR